VCHNIIAANEQVFAMAGHSVFRHTDTEADLFVLPKITTNAQQRTVSRELQVIRITAAEVRFVAPAIANIFVRYRAFVSYTL
jgi:hypothetical protein